MKNIREINERIAWLERLLLPLDGLSPGTDWAEWNRRVGLIWTEVDQCRDVSLRYSGGTCQFSMLGITTSNTAGFSHAAKSWLRKAREIVAAAEEAR